MKIERRPPEKSKIIRKREKVKRGRGGRKDQSMHTPV